MTHEETEEIIKIIRKYECNREHHEACEIAINALRKITDIDYIINADMPMGIQEDVLRYQAICNVMKGTN